MNIERMRADRISAAEAQGWKPPWRFGNEHLHGTPPSGVRVCRDGDHVPEAVDNLIINLHTTIADLEVGIKAVRDVINESRGIAGLHLNGDVASWEELLAGGKFEEWLYEFSNAEAVLARKDRA